METQTVYDEHYQPKPKTNVEKLADLALELFNAKKAEDKAKESRINIEQEIINNAAFNAFCLDKNCTTCPLWNAGGDMSKCGKDAT